MVIDTSALIAILQDEPERRVFNEAIEAAETCAMSTASFLETSMIIESRYGPDGTRDLDLFISKARITFASVDADQAYVARDAFRRYGKGRHPAGLNFGDCFAFALAKMLGEPLLFKGNDFALTDSAAYSLPKL
jgi:ribonuclease VapC